MKETINLHEQLTRPKRSLDSDDFDNTAALTGELQRVVTRALNGRMALSRLLLGEAYSDVLAQLLRNGLGFLERVEADATSVQTGRPEEHEATSSYSAHKVFERVRTGPPHVGISSNDHINPVKAAATHKTTAQEIKLRVTRILQDERPPEFAECRSLLTTYAKLTDPYTEQLSESSRTLQERLRSYGTLPTE